MATVYKYPIALADEQTVEMPAPARVLHCGYDPNGFAFVWALVEPDAETVPVVFHIRGTGQPAEAEWRYLHSVIDVPFVWHVFTEGQP